MKDAFLAFILAMWHHPSPYGAEKSLWLLRETPSPCHTSAQYASLSVLGFLPPAPLPLNSLHIFRFSFCQFEWGEEEGGWGWRCPEQLPPALTESYPEARQAMWKRHTFPLSFQVYGYVFSSFCVRSFRRADTFLLAVVGVRVKRDLKANQ